MSTAHRPTWSAAVGTKNSGIDTGGQVSRAFSVLDLPAQLKLKERQIGQGSKEELALKDLKAELEERELKHFENKKKEDKLGLLTEKEEKKSNVKMITNKSHEDPILLAVADFDDKDDDVSDDNEDSEESEDEDDDDEEELMRELEKVKAEREAAKLRKDEEEFAMNAKAREADALSGNPLLGNLASQNSQGSKLKRRWDEDVVFKNQSRGEVKVQKRFINDTIRNDFHRRFLSKYMK